MKKRLFTRVAMTASAAVLCVALAGCGTSNPLAQSNTTNTEESQNRQYMSQVNQSIGELDARLTDFIDAVSRGDVVSMRTQADKAMKVIDALKQIEAPEAISDVKAKYDEGCAHMKDALNKYVDLYTSGEEITPEKMTSIQEEYDKGAAALKEADSNAASKQ